MTDPVNARPMTLVFLGLTVSSAWGNGHATTYRALLKALKRQGHRVYFLERDKPWYSNTRDFCESKDFHLYFYYSLQELKAVHRELVRSADLVVAGSYLPEGPEVMEWVLKTATGMKAFYDIDTPVTLDKLARGDEEYLTAGLIPAFDLYLSFAGGRALQILEEDFGARAARPLYCSVDPDLYYPQEFDKLWKMGYLGTYSDDRQPVLDALLTEPARQLSGEEFVVAGPGYPEQVQWPGNVERVDHLPPDRHNKFYNLQRISLNVTRAPMKALGHSPSVRLFEAAACGTPVLSDYWDGLTELFAAGSELFVARNGREALEVLMDTSNLELKKAGAAARDRVLKAHTADHRARELMGYYEEISRQVILK